MMKQMILAYFAISLAIISHSCSAQDRKAMTFQQRMDSLLSYEKNADGPGESISIRVRDTILYQRSFGLADLKTRVKFTDSTISNLGSISKTFVAYGILKLRDEGKLSLDDNILKYFPDFKNKDIARK